MIPASVAAFTSTLSVILIFGSHLLSGMRGTVFLFAGAIGAVVAILLANWRLRTH